MRKRKLILLGVSVIIFTLLFYKEQIRLNFGILSLLIWVMVNFNTHKRKKTTFYWVLTGAVFIASLSQMWYADETTFFCLFLTTITFGIYAQHKRMAFMFYPFVMIVNYIIFLYRFLTFDWLPKINKQSKIGQKVVAFGIIPIAFAGIFLTVYTTGSDLFYNFFKNFRIDVDALEVLTLIFVGFFFFFNFWMLYIPRQFITVNNRLSFEFNPYRRADLKQTFSGIDLSTERKSGEITLILLNILLLIFITTYNYEQFFIVQDISRLSDDTHTRISTIIFSIVMAMGLILFYFKSTFNFDPKAHKLKKLAFLWLILNSLLVLSAFLKNGEYILHYGLTIKRIGVFIFLILCFIGMYFSYLKIQKQKTNFYLVTKMAWVFFFTMIFSTTINFSWVVTKYNITFQENPDYAYLNRFEYNHYILSKHKEDNKHWNNVQEFYELQKDENSRRKFLSKRLYYTFIK